jgi:hypothetical protein
LGNLVITFAQCEAALLSLVAEFKGGDEKAAADILKTHDHKETVIALLNGSGIEGFELTELTETLGQRYWDDKEVRNRYMHDQWFVGLDAINDGPVLTRGVPRRKKSSVVFNEPTPADIWNLARRFRDYDYMFDAAAYSLKTKRLARGT